MNPDPKPGGARAGRLHRAIPLTIAAIVVVVSLGLYGHWRQAATRDRATAGQSVFTIPAPGPLTIRISESGTIRAKDQIVITSEVQGRPTILSLIPEGTIVAKGDLLIELDSSQLKENLLDQQIRVQNSEAAFVRARENLAVVRNQTKADIMQAELNLRFANEDLVMYRDGEYPKKIKEMEARIALAAEELQRARQTFEGSKVLFGERFISQNELQADELAARKAELNLDLAREDLALLEQYTHQRRRDELAAAAEQNAMALERITRRTTADIVQAESDLWAREAERDQQLSRLARIEEQIEKTRITAPRGGLVVYASSTQVSWRGGSDPLAEGQEVRERQHLIYLPTTDAMIAEIKIPESRLQVVSTQMAAAMRVDALPGRVYRGQVTRIAPLPDATSVFMNPDLKVYNTEILIEGTDPDLKTGMSCTVEITAAHYENALAVPVHAVIRHGHQPVVYVERGTAFEAQPVAIGLDDNRLIHIRSGLEPGDRILLNPPLNEDDSRREAPTQEDEAVPPVAPPPAPPAGDERPRPPERARGGRRD